jgi:hypothetical protein
LVGDDQAALVRWFRKSERKHQAGKVEVVPELCFGSALVVMRIGLMDAV